MWYYVRDGQQQGPVSDEDFESLVREGAVHASTLVWREGMDDWKFYAEARTESLDVPTPPEPTQPDTTTCAECGRRFPVQDVISLRGRDVCAECKSKVVQGLKESAPGERGEGNTPNETIMREALDCLGGRWGPAIGVCVLYFAMSIAVAVVGVIIGMVVPFANNILELLIMPPLMLGLVIYFLALTRNASPYVGMLFGGFSRYLTCIGAYLMVNITVGLCTLAAMIPAIVLLVTASNSENPALITGGMALMVPGFAICVAMTYMFMLTFYLIADDDTTGATEAMKRSVELMKGRKWKFFCLNLRFVGWGFLAVLTLGIGFLWLSPYMAVSYARFYEDVR